MWERIWNHCQIEINEDAAENRTKEKKKEQQQQQKKETNYIETNGLIPRIASQDKRQVQSTEDRF